MRNLILFAALTVALAGCEASSPAPASAAAPALDLRGTWKNERGSELRIDAVDGAVLRGAFRSAVGRVDPQQWFPMTGMVNGDVIGFDVSFGAAGSVAAWAGQVDGTRLVTQWHLSRDVPDADEPTKLWSSMTSGSDTFVKE